MKINDLLDYNYISIHTKSYTQYWSSPKQIEDEGTIFRLAELNVIFKSQIMEITLVDDSNPECNNFLNKRNNTKVLITLKNGEQIKLSIADK